MTGPQLQIPAGHVCVTTFGPIRHETANCLMEMRSFSEKNGLQNVRWYMMPGALVAKARNDAVRTLLADANGAWLLMVDGDMTFAPDALLRILSTAYGDVKHADVVGGYCNLRGDLALPTIDSGTGTWESWFPGSGVVEVMRTGAAFLLTKRHVYEGMQDPWYALRVPKRPIDALAEVDNYARIKFDGQNPFRELDNREWERLAQCAEQDPSGSGDFVPAECGEDSAACDRARLAGYRIFVNTDIVIGHVDTKIVDWRQHRKAIDDLERQNRQVAGMLD